MLLFDCFVGVLYCCVFVCVVVGGVVFRLCVVVLLCVRLCGGGCVCLIVW